LLFPFKLIFSVFKSFFIILRFNPEVVIGTGGYASGPILWVASLLKIPTVIQEQNSYPGVTNKILSSKVSQICVAYPGLERFFPKDKLHLTGNPIRAEIEFGVYNRDEVLSSYGFVKDKPLVMVVGGSLGSKRINEMVLENISWFKDNAVQLIWQTGMLYYDRCKPAQEVLGESGKIQAFIAEMGPALAAADVVVSRAGAIALSELCSLGKACILVPSPNVAEDHQTKNALAVSSQNAALLIPEKDLNQEFEAHFSNLLSNKELQLQLSKNIKKLAKPSATDEIVIEIEKLINA